MFWTLDETPEDNITESHQLVISTRICHLKIGKNESMSISEFYISIK